MVIFENEEEEEEGAVVEQQFVDGKWENVMQYVRMKSLAWLRLSRLKQKKVKASRMQKSREDEAP